jgi:hypothetical protein
MERMIDLSKDDTGALKTLAAGIPQVAKILQAIAARDFPGIGLLASGIDELVALRPADYEARPPA